MPVSPSSRAIKIFISFDITSPQDFALFEKLDINLSNLKRLYPTCEWYDSQPGVGSPTIQFTEGRLHLADLIILLISPDFFASKQCYDLEMELAIARVNAGHARLIPVLVRPSSWKLSPLAQFQPLPSNGVTVSDWPNHDSAFIDVVEGIHAVLKELASQETNLTHSISQHLFSCAPPYTYDDFFTDRKPVLDDISSFFTSTRSHRTSILALSGLGGIGKTAIALEYCYRAIEAYQEILWFNASTRSMLSTHVNALASQLALPDAVQGSEPQLFATIKQWLHDQPDWLLVLDHIADMTLVDLIIPPLSNGHVLLTTRKQDTRKRAATLSVSSMDINSSALFLLRRIDMLPSQTPLDQAPAKAVQEAIAIAQAMDGFPLALEQAGAYLTKWGGNLDDYLTLYQLQRAYLLSGHEHAEDSQKAATGLHLFAFEELRGTPSLDLLYLLAFLHPDTIPEGLIANGAPELSEPLRSLAANPLTLHQALGELRSFSLVRYHADRSVLEIPRIVQDRLIDTLTIEQQCSWAEQVVRMVNHIFPVIRFDTQATCERYLPQAEHCANLISKYQLTLKEGALLLERLGSFCSRRASYARAETYLTQASRLYNRYLRTEVLDTAQTLNSLGRLYQRRAIFKKAEALHRRALELRERALGPDHPKTAESLHNLATIFGDLGRYQEAEHLYLRVLAIEERTKGARHPDIADTLNNLGLIYSQQGRYTEAGRAYRQALSIYRRSLGANHPDLAYPLTGMGTLAEKQHSYQQAEKFYTQARSIREHAFGDKHPDIARSLNKLAGIAVLEHNYQQAESLYQQALTMSEQTLGSKHPEVALILNDQALLATKQGQHQKARPLYRRALSIYRLVLGTEHPAVASVLNNLGQLSRMTGKDEQAEKFLRHALVIREKRLGTTHPSIAQSLGNLASLLATQQRYEEAELLFQQAFTLYLQIPGPRHSDVEQIPEQYASLLEIMNRNEEAREVRQVAER